MSVLSDLFLGSNILRTTASGEKVSVSCDEALSKVTSSEDGVLGIYFSAHWCPPCRQFTPVLCEWYKKLQASGKPFELVFVSSDRDDHAFNEYFGTMPFCALPRESDAKQILDDRFDVQGIPTLILLDKNGQVRSKNGRKIVMTDPEGASFPFLPKPFSSIVGNKFVAHGETEGTYKDVDLSTFSNKHIVFYFSASWCGPCQRFTPSLIKWYENLKATGRDVEIVFVSFDRSDETYASYYKKMPWLSLPFADKQTRGMELAEYFEVEGIPAAALVGPGLEILKSNVIEDIYEDPEGANFPYKN